MRLAWVSPVGWTLWLATWEGLGFPGWDWAELMHGAEAVVGKVQQYDKLPKLPNLNLKWPADASLQRGWKGIRIQRKTHCMSKLGNSII